MMIPEMKKSGRTVADMTGWAASALLIGVAAAKPGEQNTDGARLENAAVIGP